MTLETFDSNGSGWEIPPAATAAPSPDAASKPLEAAPDWSSRPWGRPTLNPAAGDNPNLVATCDFRYHGLRVRGVRVFKSERGVSVSLPQKKYGDTIQSAVYFINREERDQFFDDVIWVYNHVYGNRRPLRASA